MTKTEAIERIAQLAEEHDIRVVIDAPRWGPETWDLVADTVRETRTGEDRARWARRMAENFGRDNPLFCTREFLARCGGG
jgi:hypothetical protein